MADEINDGGPAFPFGVDYGDGGYEQFHGMSLRDYFAAAAMTGLLASPRRTGRADQYARDAWDQADAMLAARERKEGTDG
jgi:hypothetical protein